MDPRALVLDSLSGDVGEDLPVAIFTQSATVGMMEATGVSWPEAHSDPRRMAALGSAQADLFGFPTVRVPFDITAEAERLGCAVDMGTRELPPNIVHRAFDLDPMNGVLPDVSDLMSPSEFLGGGRPGVVIDAVSICSKREDVAVCAGMLGPMTLLSQAMGAENALVATFLEPSWAEGWCSALNGILVQYASSLSDAGADVLTIVEGVASPDTLDPLMFMDLSGRHLRDMAAVKDAKTVLHICGSAEPILGMIPSTGVDAFSPDPKVSPDLVIERLKGRVAAVGAVDPVRTLLMGTTEDVVSEAERFGDAGYAVITPGCGLAPMTSDANLRTLSGFGSP